MTVTLFVIRMVNMVVTMADIVSEMNTGNTAANTEGIALITVTAAIHLQLFIKVG